jgi:acetyl esterase/lipase
MSFIGKILSPGSRVFKRLVYDAHVHQIRGLGFVKWVAQNVCFDDPNVRIKPMLVEGLEAAWFEPTKLESNRVLLYFHGGGYSVCSWETHRSLISNLCKASGMRTLAVNYRLAPEHPFPAAVDDAVITYNFLLKTEQSSDIVVGGDSAGGGLTMALLLSLKHQGIPLPFKVIALSPWLDLSVPSEERNENVHQDPLLDAHSVKVWAQRYLQTTNPQNCLASPIYGDLKDLPPMLIHVGEREMLLDDTVRFIEKARDAGVDAHLKIWPSMVHVFQFLTAIVPEAKQSVNELGMFIRH